MSLIKWNQPSRLTSKKSWIENLLIETDDLRGPELTPEFLYYRHHE